eukprot:CAMPEP_0198240706 /NCGR_PEP_ID=MMETSP1446-20131203/5728_1 /TAXON_ID=1461542 ORGANISM="Unidentified sp, Strain CCMP2111" /NCGR_SAMPLE_ID=MMETSP1446 /ASSEMBLY_ACC=CAM_ASM_001112 /LENGTH=803 /DNA_ID=CAMNT_0043923453 /DNA_START=248 /DNA_END=2659 /DNA_ORIENTATION=+
MILVLVAHNGCTYELEADSSTRVDKVQIALENLTSIALEDQILTLEGSKLDGSNNKTFQEYGLSDDVMREGQKVFMYSKKLLHPDSLPSSPETLPALNIEVPSLDQFEVVKLPLLDDDSSSASARNLPSLEQQFRYHLAKGKSILSVSTERFRISERLLSEQEVQAQAIDSAQENVDKHYAFICRLYDDFQRKCVVPHREHWSECINSFPGDLKQLEKTQTHESVRSFAADPAEVKEGEQGEAEKHKPMSYVADLLPKEKLWAWHEQCIAMHTQFKPKVEEISSLYTSVKHDVEALFMTVPSVDLTKLSEQLHSNRELLAEMETVVEVFHKDYQRVSAAISTAVKHQQQHTSLPLSTDLSGECSAAQLMNEQHVLTQLPRMEECCKVLERFTKHCVDCKNAMSRCVHTQMKSIAILQNRIRAARNKLSAYKEVGRNMEDACQYLSLVHHIPAAYNACLAEVMRRRAFADIVSLHAQRFAEAMSSLRQQEEAARVQFSQRQEIGLLPSDLLTCLKLHLAPPVCEVHVSPDEYEAMGIEVEDIGPARADSGAEGVRQRAVAVAKGTQKAFSRTLEEFNQSEGRLFRLQMENAALKAEVASCIASSSKVLGTPGDEAGGSEGGGGSDTARTEVFSKAQAAVDAKDDVITSLMEELAARKDAMVAQEANILALEKELEVLRTGMKVESLKVGAADGSVAPTSPVGGSTGSKANILSRCAMRDFKIHDVAVFVEASFGKFEAVHDSCPRHFLSPESVELSKKHQNKSYVIGQIVHIEPKRVQADQRDIYSRDLCKGDEYFLVTICLVD